jgi:hypothetical protein
LCGLTGTERVPANTVGWACEVYSMLHSFRAYLILISVLVLALPGCAGAPVQEMSNARQAIKAAREAGAGKVVPETLNEAQTLLERAEINLQKRAYRDARRYAIAARGKAGEALGAVQLSDADGAG